MPARPRTEASQLKLWLQLKAVFGQAVPPSIQAAGHVALDAEHELVDLQIVADLAADQPAAAAVAGGDAGRVGELPVEIRPAVADVGADIDAGP